VTESTRTLYPTRRRARKLQMVDYPKYHAPLTAARTEAAIAAGVVGAAVTVVAVWLPFRTETAVWVSILTYSAIVGIVLARIGTHYPHHRLGVANLVTILRAGGVALFAGLAVEPAALASIGEWSALIAALVLLSLDGIDGIAARRQRLESEFGARFDMEVDALFILVLACLALGLEKAGPWVLGLGLMRYAFLAAGNVAPWLAAPLPPSIRRKTVCVLQIAALAMLLVPPASPPASQAIAAVAFIALAWSFTVDVRWLARRRRAMASA
jgi:phosphatidylglycerophosphate synthase